MAWRAGDGTGPEAPRTGVAPGPATATERAELARVGPSPLLYSPAPELATLDNRVAVLRDGAEAFPAIFEAMARARRFIHLETYIFNDDNTGRRFAAALTAAARRGVEVAVLYDSLGSWRSGSWIFGWMALHGVKVVGFKPLAPWRRGWGWFRRDHRKQVIVDGVVGFTGGINIGDQWAQAIEGGRGWRDTMVRVVGPAVGELDGLFRQVWRRELRRQRLPHLALTSDPGPQGLEPLLMPGEVERSHIWILSNREFKRRRLIRRAYRFALERARRYAFIANPYFVPDRAILRSLKAARERGVRVALILPGISDLRSVQWAAQATFDRLLSWGIELYRWRGPVFHAKTAVIDGVWSTVGSYNLDTQSLRYNLEVTAVMLSPQVGAELERMFLADLANCERVELGAWRQRSWWSRIPERIFYALRGLL